MINDREKDNLAEKVLRMIIAFVVVMAFVVPFLTPNVFAASSVSISGGDNVKGGDTFTVAVTFDGGNIGRVDAYMTYDTNKLTYISGGTSNGNTGYIQLKKAGTDGSIVFNIQFQAVSDGTADLEVTTDEMYDFDDAALENPSATKTITISGNAAPEALVTETTSPDKPVDTTELVGVDEKPEGSPAVNLNVIFIVAAAILVILIVIISVILAKKKKKNGEPVPEAPKNSLEDNQPDLEPIENNETYDNGDDIAQAYENTMPSGQPRIGRSGKILDASAAGDDSWLDELMSGEPSQKRRDPQEEKIQRRERNREIKKQANEETELWREWDLNTKDDSDDIEKW